MPRIRTLTAVGVLAGATVLGGAGLAGATDDTSEPKDQDLIEESQSQQPTTFESDEETETDEAPTAPTLPEAAADRATTALAEAPAFAEDDAETTAPDVETTQEQQADPEENTTEVDDPETEAKPDTHGQRVSEVARGTEPGPDHGPTVAEEAKKNGQGGDDVEDDGDIEND